MSLNGKSLPPGAILKLLDILGCSYKKYANTYGAICPFHDDKNPSAIVDPYTNTFACTVCGEELVKRWYSLRGLEYKPEPRRYYFISTKAVAFLSGFSQEKWKKFLKSIPEDVEFEFNKEDLTVFDIIQPVDLTFSKIWDLCEDYIDASAVLYLKSRKIDGVKLFRENIIRYLSPDAVDLDDRLKSFFYQGYKILIPMYDFSSKKIVGLQLRKVPDEKNKTFPKAKFFPGSQITDFGLEALDSISLASFIVEGSTDYLTLKSLGFKSVLGLSNVNSTFYKDKRLVSSLSDIIFLFYDKDKPGIRLANTIRSYFKKHYPEKKIIPLNILSDDVKDVNDFFVKDPLAEKNLFLKLKDFFGNLYGKNSIYALEMKDFL